MSRRNGAVRSADACKGLLAVLGAGLLVALAGCQTPPPGNTGGRADPYRSTPADQYSREASTVTLLEFSDAVPQAVAQRIARIPEIRDAPTRVAIEIGTIQNSTRTPTSDFSLIRRRVIGQLVNSDIVANFADIYERPEVMDREAQRLGGGQDLLDERVTTPQTARYPAETVYVLNGEFHEATRGQGEKSLYLFDFTLTNLGSRRIVFSEQLTSAQVR